MLGLGLLEEGLGNLVFKWFFPTDQAHAKSIVLLSKQWENLQVDDLTDKLKRLWGINERDEKLCKSYESFALSLY